MAVETPKEQVRRIWLIGDSLGVGLLPHLKALALADGMDLQGSPVGGTSIEQWTDNVKYQQSIADAVTWPATTFLVSLGTNDAASASSSTNIAKLVKAMQANGARVIWIGPPTLPATKQFPRLKTIYSDLMSQCRALGVPYIDSRYAKHERSKADGIHDTPAGYSQWVAWLWPKIKKEISPGSSTAGWIVGGALGGLLIGAIAWWVASGRKRNPRRPYYGEDEVKELLGRQDQLLLAADRLESKRWLTDEERDELDVILIELNNIRSQTQRPYQGRRR